MKSKKLIYCFEILGGYTLFEVLGGCASPQVQAQPRYKWVYESSGIGRIVEEPSATGIERAVLSTPKAAMIEQNASEHYSPSYCNAASGFLLGTAGLCLAMAAILKYRQLTKNRHQAIISNKKRGMPKINLLPPELRGGRIKKAIRYIYHKIPKRKEPDYPMPGYDKKGWDNYGN